MNNNHESSNPYAFYWPYPPAAGMAYNQQVFPTMNMNLMAAAAPGWDPQVPYAQMTLQNNNNEGIAVAANKSTMFPTVTFPTQVGNEKKRKADDAADHDSCKPKKKVYNYYCNFENCTNQAHVGGVCRRHGAKVRNQRCSREGCEKYAQVGGVCIRHGKRCSHAGCEKHAKVGGVCMRHWSKVKQCSVKNCTNHVQKGGVCYRHNKDVPPPQEKNKKNKMLCGFIEDGGNQRNDSTMVEISGNEEGGKHENEPSITTQKQKAKIAHQNERGSQTENNAAGEILEQDAITVAANNTAITPTATTMQVRNEKKRKADHDLDDHGSNFNTCNTTHWPCPPAAKMVTQNNNIGPIAVAANNAITVPSAATFVLMGDEKRKEDDAGARGGGSQKRKVCNAENCTNYAVSGGVCIRHGATVKRCSHEGCEKHVVKGGVCWKHGGKRDFKRCSKDGCKKFAQNGGVCIRHGATRKKKKKRCNHEGCTNQAQKIGVCKRHGAKVKRKRCREEGCENKAVEGGVCQRHGATWKKKRCSKYGCEKQAQNGGVCYEHGATPKLCRVTDCTKRAKKGGVCWRHRKDIPPPWANIEDGENQRTGFAVLEVSGNEEGGNDKNEPPIATQKRKAKVANQVEWGSKKVSAGDELKQGIARTEGFIYNNGRSDFNDDEGKGPSKMRRQNESMEGMNTVVNKDQEKSDAAPADNGNEGRQLEEEIMDDEIKPHDSREEEEAQDVALMQHNVERGSNAKEQEVNWDYYDQNEYQNEHDLSGANSRSVNSGVDRQPHVCHKQNNATADASTDDVEKDLEIQRLRAELKEAVSLNEQLKQNAIEVDTIKARSQSDGEKQQSVVSRLHDLLRVVSTRLNEKSPLVHDLELVRAGMDTQLMRTATARLEERLAKDAACVKLDEVTKKLETTESLWKSRMEEREDDLLSELKAKSCVIEELRRENESLRHQLELKNGSAQCAVKEEELTDDEYIFSRWKESKSRNECSVKEEELTDDE